jgi:hypothetical protein
MLNEALEYAANGWHVFPVKGKQPLLPWRENSTDNADTIRGWDWTAATGIGIDCGKSGLVVLDIDDLQAVPALSGKLGFDPTEDDTTIVRTGRGGVHVYYRAGSNEVRNSASKIIQGVDVRGVGGFVVAPPSVHDNGSVYEFTRNNSSIRPIPESMVQALNYKEERQPSPAPAPFAHEKWGLAILAAEAHNIESSQPGQRNDQLYRSALPVWSAVKGGHLDYSMAEMRLVQAGLRVGLEETEVRNTIASAWDTAQPRHPEEPAPRMKEPDRPKDRKSFRALNIEQLRDLPPPQWLLKERVPEGQTWMYGEAGAGKSFLALHWASLVAASGLPVVYFIGEGVQGFAQRILAWQSYWQKDISALRVVPQAPHLLERESVAMMKDTVEEYHPSLIVIDTFARASVGGDENSARDMGIAIDVLDSLWHDYHCSSLVLHHSSKGGGVERGSSAIRGAADATWEVRPGIEGDVTVGFEAVCRKMKDSEPPRPVYCQLRRHGESAIIVTGSS